MRKVVVGMVVLGVFLFWELASRYQPSLRFVLPPPSAILETLVVMRDRFLFHTLVTCKEMVLGFALALSAAFPLAWSMFRSQTTRLLLQPLFVLIQCIPMFTLAPLMVIWFGWGLTAIVIPTALMIFFPLTLNLYQGLRSTPQPLVDFFNLNGATPWQTLIKLRLPAALPHLFSGLRLSAAISGIGAVAGEWAGAQHGLGILMLESRRNSDLEITFGALICLSAMTLSLYGGTLFLERLCQRKQRLSHLLPTLLLLGCLVGCQRPVATTLLLDWLPNPNHIPLYVGIDQGYFREEGIDLHLQKMFDNGGGISYLTSGHADLILAHLPGTLKACSRGAQLHIVGVLIPCPLRALIYREDLAITSPPQLTDCRLGYCIGGPDTAFLDFLLAHGEIVPSTRKNVSVDLIAAMGTHAVDFIYGGFWNIEPYQLDSLGTQTKYFPIESFGVPSYPELLAIADHTNPKIDADFAMRFRRALEKSISFCRQHPSEAFAAYLASNLDKSLKTKAWEALSWNATLPILPTTQIVDRASIEEFYHWQLTQRILTKSFDISSLLSLYPEESNL